MRLIPRHACHTVVGLAAILAGAPAWAAGQDTVDRQATSFAAQSAAAATDTATSAAVPRLAAPSGEAPASWSAATGAETARPTAFTGRVGGLAEGGGLKPWHNATLPVPEPNTYMLMLAGLGVIGLVARRRRRG